MASFDYERVTIGSGSAEASPRSAPVEKGYRVGVMAATRWPAFQLPDHGGVRRDLRGRPASESLRMMAAGRGADERWRS